MKTPEEHDADHAVRVRIAVTIVVAIAVLGAEFFPHASGWLGFSSTLFWIWRN